MHVPVLTTRLKEEKKTPWKKTFHKSEKRDSKQLYLDKNRKRTKIIKCHLISTFC